MDQFIEIALSSGGGFFLIHKLKIVLIKLLKEVVPRDFRQAVIVLAPGARETKAKNSRLISAVRAGHFRRNGPSFLRPIPYFFMILRRF
ncbi:MAG TPA: hypothetical protein VFL96_03010 [Acidobacteriaceae bacterium]|nr:hypothetical protein [Acidobacteriaceae bacterium]